MASSPTDRTSQHSQTNRLKINSRIIGLGLAACSIVTTALLSEGCSFKSQGADAALALPAVLVVNSMPDGSQPAQSPAAIFINQADSLLAQHSWDMAIGLYRAALATHLPSGLPSTKGTADYVLHKLSLCHLYNGLEAKALGDYNDSPIEFQAALADDPTNLAAKRMLSQVLAEDARTQAERYVEAATSSALPMASETVSSNDSSFSPPMFFSASFSPPATNYQPALSSNPSEAAQAAEMQAERYPPQAIWAGADNEPKSPDILATVSNDDHLSAMVQGMDQMYNDQGVTPTLANLRHKFQSILSKAFGESESLALVAFDPGYSQLCAEHPSLGEVRSNAMTMNRAQGMASGGSPYSSPPMMSQEQQDEEHAFEAQATDDLNQTLHLSGPTGTWGESGM